MSIEKVNCVCQICNGDVLVNKYAAKKWTKCKPCSARLNAKNNIGRKATPEQNRVNSELRKGSNNPFYGKKHTDETKLKLGSYERTEKQRDSAREILKENKKYNTLPYFQVWVNKYGIDIANQKLHDLKIRHSKNSSGENNPMFGRPAPEGSGNGWSGWYKGIFFRSLLELAFLKKMIEEGINFESGELKCHGIPYVMDDTNRTYFPDYYLVDTETYVEIKPKRLTLSRENMIKFEAAKLSCNNFQVITEYDIKKLTNEEIVRLYISGDLKWMERYEHKFFEKYL
jgi:hypothetical protein